MALSAKVSEAADDGTGGVDDEFRLADRVSGDLEPPVQDSIAVGGGVAGGAVLVDAHQGEEHDRGRVAAHQPPGGSVPEQ